MAALRRGTTVVKRGGKIIDKLAAGRITRITFEGAEAGNPRHATQSQLARLIRADTRWRKLRPSILCRQLGTRLSLEQQANPQQASLARACPM